MTIGFPAERWAPSTDDYDYDDDSDIDELEDPEEDRPPVSLGEKTGEVDAPTVNGTVSSLSPLLHHEASSWLMTPVHADYPCRRERA